MSDILLKKRGRGRPSNAEIAARKAALEARAPKVRSDDEILENLTERFEVLARQTQSAINGNMRAMVVAGAPGVGKSYTVERILSTAEVPHKIIDGKLTAISLYMQAYKYRHAGNVLVLDDADSIFNDDDGINILKALCDTREERRVCYLSNAKELKEGDEEIPQEFVFNGAMIFISNLDFQTFIDEGKTKYALHFEALMSRALYLELRLQSRAEIGVWVNHIAEKGRIFDREMVPKEHHAPILAFIQKHRDDMRELSVRTLLKLSGMVKDNPETWEADARVLLLRSNYEVTND